ncbi:glycoside hydrolase family 125 protein [Microlunatus ginsengisoli]|uniref:Glycoside hydrolase family 125 protein n=1 Tax=Microlunatus ginsengisoli TaxID=363863 RepID=A0ABP7AN25_9ACTN
MDVYTPAMATDVIEGIGDALGPAVAAVFSGCFLDTLEHTIALSAGGSAFVVTGDIPAMWLRDSTVQLTPYLHFLERDPKLAQSAIAVSRRQLACIDRDPYANAFNQGPDGAGHWSDQTEMSPWVWERKYEVDSLAYPVQLAYDIWTLTGRTEHLELFPTVARSIVGVWRTEQDHDQTSSYRFERPGSPGDSLARRGLGRPTGHTGLTWSAFRPSDDTCVYNYNVPANMLAFVELSHIAELADAVFDDWELAADARDLRDSIGRGLTGYAVTTGPSQEPVYAYELDGLGGVLVMDDANTPSLLSLPLIGWCELDDPLYQRTRAFLLSEANPTFSRGAAAAGIGSPHTPPGSIWPIALAVQGLTALDHGERDRMLSTLMATHADTDRMHESFDKDDPTIYTRPWFSWANAMFCELALDCAGMRTYRRTAAGTVLR